MVIDAGHGGKDPGCHGELYKEKDVALAVALKLGKFIEENLKDVKVIFTRKTDVFVELNERAAIANRNSADLFICVHCNSACVYDKRTRKETCNESAHGAETYVMGVNKDAGNLAVAKRENKSILLEDNYKKAYDGFDPNSDEANILFTIYQSVYRTQSSNLAAKIQECYKQKAGRNDKGLQQAGFLVLWKTAMPSLLTEIGYLTNRKEEKFLGSEKGQTVMASSIFRAFRMYKNELEGSAVKYNDEFEKESHYDPDKDTLAVSPVKVPDKPEKKAEPELKHKDEGPAGIIEERKKKSMNTETGSAAAEHPEPLVSPVIKEENAAVKDPAGLPGNEIGKGLGTSQGNPAASDPASLSPKEMAMENRHADTAPVPAKMKEAKPEKKAPAVPGKGASGEATVYKVLFYASEKKMSLEDKKFQSIDSVGSFEEAGRFKYTSGTFLNKADAEKHQDALRKLGFKDAFVVSFRQGKRVK